MAERPTTRRTMLAAMAIAPAAVAVPAMSQSPIAEWDYRLMEYQARKLLLDADEAFGAHAVEAEEIKRGFSSLKWKHGSREAAIAKEGAKWDALIEAEDRNNDTHYERFYRRVDLTAIALVSTPAPSLAAVQIKIDIIKELRLETDTRITFDLFEVIESDVKRLTGVAA